MTNRRGGILLEVMLSMAIFVAAAAFILSATRNVFSGLERSMREQQALDIARSKMAELDAGLVGIMDLRESDVRRVGSIDSFADENDLAGGGSRWIVDVSTQRTEYSNLTLVELTVRENRDGADAASHTMRQLVRLREQDAQEYEADDLVQRLPTMGGGM